MAVSSSKPRSAGRADAAPTEPAQVTAAPSTAAPSTADGVSLDALLATAPLWEKQVLELAPSWPELAAELRWGAERLRIFLVTWDPFEWRPDRAAAFATSTSRADGVGLVLYLPHWQALRLAGDAPLGLAAALTPLVQSILEVGGDQQAAIEDGSYAAGVHARALPRLLSRVPGTATLALPALRIVGAGWRPIQFDVLEDLGQDLFGPADLDRSAVRFREPGEHQAGCPGCGGRAVEFPDGLKDTQDAICATHRGEALRITTARLEAAKASNPDGWEALLDAGQRLLEPHLPNGLGPRLLAAATPSPAPAAPGGPTAPTAPAPAALAGQAAAVTEAASLMTGLPDQTTALGGRLEPVRAWLPTLPGALEAAGFTAEVAAVTAAVDELLAPPGQAAARAAAEAAEAELPAKPQPFRREARVGRNALCPCGSGKKYKFCHGR